MTTTALDRTRVLRTLRQVIDPELGCNIVDLGLVYGVAIEGNTVRITMTVTSPGCPMQETMRWGVQNALLQIEAVHDAEVEVVFDQPWTPAMMTAAGREATNA